MTNWFSVLMAISAALITSAVSAQRVDRQAAQFGWQSNYQQARESARKSDKPLMVVFRCEP